MFDRTVESLSALPSADAAAISRIVAAAARARASDVSADDTDLEPLPRGRSVRWPAVSVIAAAAAIAGFFAGSYLLVRSETASPSGASVPTPALAPTPTSVVSAPAPDALPVPTQFVFDSRRAKRVSLVGDFNGWDERAAPLVREPGSALWSVTVPLLPGRHTYAFLVDSTWTTDPRAPRSRDPDFGVPSSVIIVGRP